MAELSYGWRVMQRLFYSTGPVAHQLGTTLAAVRVGQPSYQTGRNGFRRDPTTPFSQTRRDEETRYAARFVVGSSARPKAREFSQNRGARNNSVPETYLKRARSVVYPTLLLGLSRRRALGVGQTFYGPLLGTPDRKGLPDLGGFAALAGASY